MRTTANFRRVIAVISSIVMVMSMVLSMSASVTAATYYTLTYSAGDVDNIVGSTEINYQRAANTLFDVASSTRFSRKGYYLASWYIPSTGDTVGVSSQYTMPSRDITFVANWKPQTYAVTFTGKGGKTANGSANFYVDGTYGTPMTLPENQFIYDGYTFAGWKYDGIVYNEGDTFEIPAILSTAKVVLAATWTTAQSTPVTTITTATTTTTTTTIATTTSTNAPSNGTSSETIVKTYEINGEVNYSSNKVCNIDLNEILKDGQIQSLVINFSSHTSSNIGTVIGAVSATSAGKLYQMDLGSSFDAPEYALNFGDTEVCQNLESGNLSFNYWWGSTSTIYVDSVTATLIPSEKSVMPETTITTTTTMPETTTTTTTTTTMPETTTTTTTTTIMPETTTTTTTTIMPETTTTTTTIMPETTTTTTTTMSETTTTTTTTTVPETTITTTTMTTFEPSPFSKVINVNETISIGHTLDFATEELISTNKIVESVQIKASANGKEIKGYSFSIGIRTKDNFWHQVGLNGVTYTDEFTFGEAVPEELQAYVKSEKFLSIGYWWGDYEEITIEEITINYRIDTGDYNNDGIVDSKDTDVLKHYMVGAKVDGYNVEINTADINGDGVVNVFDYMCLSRDI